MRPISKWVCGVLLLYTVVLNQVTANQEWRQWPPGIDSIELDVGSAELNIGLSENGQIQFLATGFNEGIESRLDGHTLKMGLANAGCTASVDLSVSNEHSTQSLIVLNGRVILSSAGYGTADCASITNNSELMLKLPEDIDVIIKDFRGSAFVHGPLSKLNFSGAGDLSASVLQDAVIQSRGNARISIEAVKNKLVTNLRGNSKVQIRRGGTTIAELQSQGNASFQHEGSVDRLSVKSTQNSSIHINDVGTVAKIVTRQNAQVCIKHGLQDGTKCRHRE